MKKFICCIIACVMLLSLGVTVSAATDYPIDLPYESYIYSQRGDPLIVPAPYASDRVLHGSDIAGWSAFKAGIESYSNRKLIEDVRELLIAEYAKDAGNDAAQCEALCAASLAQLADAYGVQTPAEAVALYLADEGTLDAQNNSLLDLNANTVEDALETF